MLKKLHRSFKTRYNNHTLSFRHQQKSASTELSERVWQQKEKGKTTKSRGILSSKLTHTIVAQNHATFTWLKNYK